MRHCFRFFPAAVLLSLLVTACAPASSPDAPSLQATELGHGTSRTSVETQIQSGSLSSDNGAWLTLQVKTWAAQPSSSPWTKTRRPASP